MDTPIERILRELGIPLECCPTCHMTNWEFFGAVDVGIYRVTCRTCGRRYERVTRREELLFLARGFRYALESETEEQATHWYRRIVNRWNTPVIFGEDVSAMVCTVEGYYEDANDDIAF